MSNSSQVAGMAKLRIASPILRLPSPILRRGPVAPSQPANPSVFLASRTARPLWFDGRFLAAADLRREQNYFLRRQAAFGQAAGPGILHGLTVDQGSSGQIATNETLIIRAGVGITPSGELVMISSDLTIQLTDLADQENLDEQFGVSESPQQPARTRTGIYVIVLRRVKFTANPIVSYPSSLGTAPVAQDGDIVEATAVSLIPYPNPITNSDPATQQAMLARQIFLEGSFISLPDSVLPLAMVGLDRNAIQWLDMFLVRRESGPQTSAVRLDLSDPATQQACLLQYDAKLKAIVGSLAANTAINATTYFQALPPAGALPIASINTTSFTQVFFPPLTNVRLSLVPSDELPALIEEGISLPPIDLTQPASTFANLAVAVLVPVPRANYASAKATAPDVNLTATPLRLPILRPPLPILRLLPGGLAPGLPVSSGTGWPGIVSGMSYAFYTRLRDQANYVPMPVVTS